MTEYSPLVSIIMGSQSDWPTMKHGAEILEVLDVPFETRIVSAHRTPERMYEFAKSAENWTISDHDTGNGGPIRRSGLMAKERRLRAHVEVRVNSVHVKIKLGVRRRNVSDSIELSLRDSF